MTWEIESQSSADTEQLGEQLAAYIKAGDVVELKSDLGGGKTTLTRGLVRGLGATDVVSSPTFTISKEYTSGKLPIVHADFYRLQDATYLDDAFQELIGDGESVVVIEWGDLMENVLPDDRIVITLERIASSEDARKIIVTAPRKVLGFEATS